MPPEQEPNDDMKANKKVKVPLPKINLSTSEKHFSLAQLSVFILIFAVIGGYVIYRSFAATVALATVQSEAMNLPTGTSVITDSTASGTKAVKMSANGSLSASFSLPSSSASLTVTARGDQCSGSPALAVAVDGTTRINTTAVANTTYSGYSATFNLASGTHSLTVTGTNLGSVFAGNSGNVKCARILYLDVAIFYGPSVTPPTVSLTANPSTITSGSSSTLAWSSTNTTSCSAPWTSSTATSGSQSVTPTTTTTYGITCTGAGGSVSASVIVTVNTTTGTKLTWAPPVLTNQTNVQIQDTGQACPNSQNPTLPLQNTDQPWACKLAANQDYILKIHDRNSYSVNQAALTVDGGRNVVIIGGKLTPGPHTCCDRTDEWKSRGIQFKNQTGIVHVEGVQIDSASDAISFTSPQATFQFENIRVTNLHAYQDNTVLSHPDMIQSFDAAKDIRVDHFTGDSDYQGFSWFSGVSGWSAKVTIKNVNLWGNLQLNTVQKWPDGTTRTKDNFHVVSYMNYSNTVNSCTNCWAVTGWYSQNYQRRLYESFGLMNSAGTSDNPASFKVTGYDGQVLTAGNNGSLSGSPYDVGRRQGDYIEFPSYPNLAGVRWYWGTPTAGNFVPDGVAGPNYTSPGYQ